MPIKTSVDLNVDLAEGCAYDRELLQLVSSANIACGVHAGSAVEMRHAVRWAVENGVRIGAHPSFPDRENFGRTAMNLPADDLRAHLRYQLGALAAVCRAEGARIAYVKAHGALYNQAAKDAALAALIAQEVAAFDSSLKLMGLSGSLMLEAAAAQGLAVVSEVFADRRYLPDGSLVPRSRADAVVDSDAEAIAQVLQMLEEGRVDTVGGGTAPVQADSVCLHGDNAHALQFAREIRAALQQKQIAVAAL